MNKLDRERFEFSSRPRQKPNGKQCYGYSIKLDKNFKSVNNIKKTDIDELSKVVGSKKATFIFNYFKSQNEK